MRIYVVDDDAEQRMIMADFLDTQENALLDLASRANERVTAIIGNNNDAAAELRKMANRLQTAS